MKCLLYNDGRLHWPLRMKYNEEIFIERGGSVCVCVSVCKRIEFEENR